MRVLLINYEYPPIGAGSATAACAIARALTAVGHSATVLTSRFGNLAGVLDESGVRVIRVASRRGRREAASISEMASFVAHAIGIVRQVVRAERIDGIIAFFSIPGGPVAWWAHRGTGVPFVVSLRGGDVPGAEARLGLLHRCLAPLRRRILFAARAVVANSPGLRAISEKIDPVPVNVIPNGVDSSFFCPPATHRSRNGPCRLLFVGRFQAQKNLHWLLEQLAEVRSFKPKPFTMDLVGDGPQLRSLTAHVHALGLTDIVRFHGWQERVALRSYYQTTDLLINPSHYEGMSNVLLEAMACGCAVLASNVPGNDSVVVDGVTGWLFALRDAASFRARISRVISDPETAFSLGVSGRARVELHYSWARTAQRYLELLA